MLKFLKNWTLPIAMLVGAVGYPVFISFSFLTPILIFTMLLLTEAVTLMAFIDSDIRIFDCLSATLSF